jgi:uncharacterized Zn-finger protein
LTTFQPPETIAVHEHRVACDGGGGALGHPRVFLELGEEGAVDCPYCGRHYQLSGHVHAEDEEKDPADYQGSSGH